MPEYALILFAVLLLGAAGVRKVTPALVNGADTTRRILSGEDVNVNGNPGNTVSGVANATQGGVDPNGDGSSVGGGGAASGGSNSSNGGGSFAGGGARGGGGSTAVGGSGTGTSSSIAGASAGGGGMLLAASGSSAFGGGDNLGGGGGLTLGSFSTESASGGGSGSGGSGSSFGSGGGGTRGGGGSGFGNTNGAGGSSGGGGFANGGSSSSPFAGSSGGNPFASAGNALLALFSPSSSQSSRAASGSGGSSSGSANEQLGNAQRSSQSSRSQMPVGLLGASRSNEVNPPPGQGAVNGPGYSISAQGERQMQALLAQARRNAGGKRPKGRCYHQVKIDIQEVGYGNIPRQTANAQLRPLPSYDQGYAHNFADYMNARASNGQTNATNLGLQRLPINNPYDAPPGSIIVVRAGTPGTHNPVAGDIVVAGGHGTFYNDGNMGYRGSQNFRPGNNYVLGIYAPR